MNMHRDFTHAIPARFFLLPFILLFTINVSARDVDWGSIDATTIKMFYPGTASWEFVKDRDHGTGGPPVKKIEKTCADCHVNKAGEYDINADKIVSGELLKSASKKPLEPQPIKGAAGFKNITVQAAYDASNLYLRLQWSGSGASVADAALAKSDQADRVSIQVGDKIKTFRNYGCFVTCHNDQKGMPENRGTDVKLYGYYTRNDDGSVKPADVLDGYLSKGQFLDLWVVAFEGSKVTASDEYILDDRREDTNNLSATGTFKDKTYSVVITRPLSTGDTKDIVLQDGTAFSIGIAVHDDHAKDRKHYTSFPVSIGLSSPADINARKL